MSYEGPIVSDLCLKEIPIGVGSVGLKELRKSDGSSRRSLTQIHSRKLFKGSKDGPPCVSARDRSRPPDRIELED